MNDKQLFVLITALACGLLFSSLSFTIVIAFEIDQVATCTYVYDGDSFETTFGEVRLADIDAPEYNDTSRNVLVALINNEEVYLDVDDIYQTDPYGRYVCVTYVEVNATHLLNVNQYLLNNGYAVVTNYNNEFNPASWTLYKSKIATSIICSVAPSTMVFDEIVTVSGSILPVRAGVEVTLRYTSPDDTVTEHHVVTTIDGSYSDTFTTSILGSWLVTASWSGDSIYLGSTSFQQPFTVTKRPSSLSCSLPSSSIVLGDNITLSGLFLPMRAGETITVNYRHDLSWQTLTTVTTGLDGSYAYTWTPPTAGSYQLQATWPGDPLYAEASSAILSLTVTKLPSTITCDALITTLAISDNLTLSGDVLPIREGIAITLQYQTESGWTAMPSVTTNAEGHYSYVWTPSAGGSYFVRAICPEDDTYNAATSSIHTITVEKLSTNITCTVSPVDVVVSKDVSVSGSLSPAMSDITVTITYTAPDASTVTRTVMTGPDGSFIDTFRPDAIGGWTVVASWEGDAIYHDALSTSIAITTSEQNLQLSPIIIGIPIILILLVVVVVIIRRR